MTPTHVVFVPLAGNQARFYLSVARALAADGTTSSFLTYHEPSLDVIREAGFDAESGFVPPDDRTVEAALAVIDRFGVPDVNLVISHERAAYEIGDGRRLVTKFSRHLERAADVLSAAAGRTARVEVVQELGGFLSVAAVFHAARHLGLRTTFIEPSFFRGRVFFTHDTFGAPRPTAPDQPVSAEVRTYLDRTLEEKRIVIPDKDRGHYRPAWRKIVNRRNTRRLVEKTFDKHLRGRREEFDHLSGHVSRHVRMAVSGQRLRRYYQPLPTRPFVYYPLHVPADVALTIRAPEYYDQIGLLDWLARAIPPTHLLLVKEHPALVGALDYRRAAALLARYDNVVLLDPGINNHDVLGAADLVVTVNSKSGAEALLQGTRVLALGDSFYRDSGLVTRLDRPGELPAAVRAALAGPPPERGAIATFFQRVWDSSRPGELYLDDDRNPGVFAASLRSALNQGAGGEA